MKKIILATTLIVIVFTACKKIKVEEPAAPVPTHLGLWKGKFSNSMTTQPTFPLFALLTQDGKVKVYNGVDTATAAKYDGIWALTGTIIQMVYQIPGANNTNFILLFSNESYTANSGGINSYYGTGNPIINGLYSGTAIGNVSFTKP